MRLYILILVKVLLASSNVFAVSKQVGYSTYKCISQYDDITIVMRYNNEKPEEPLISGSVQRGYHEEGIHKVALAEFTSVKSGEFGELQIQVKFSHKTEPSTFYLYYFMPNRELSRVALYEDGQNMDSMICINDNLF